MCWFWRKRKTTIEELLTIDDLAQQRSSLRKISLKDKKNVKILFLDDEGYDLEPLQGLGYIDVNKKYKHEKMDEYAIYDIIFCDVNGIAVEVDPELQGAMLAKKIKETYPEKIVVIFSAKKHSLEINKLHDYVDDIIPKNVAPSEISEKIDSYIDKINDPIAFWYNMRRQLLNQGASIKNIASMENYYVKSILYGVNHQQEIKNEFKDYYAITVNAICQGIATYLAIKE